MNKTDILIIVLLTVTAVLLGNAIAISRDYQDSWILEGLEIPFVLFVLTYALAFFSQKKVSWLVALAMLGRFVFLVVPNLKYVWYQGIYVDQQQQYALANYVYENGYVSTRSIYGFTPLEHLTFSIFSVILGVPVADSMKYVPVLSSLLYPLLTYVIINRMDFFRRTAVLKYGLFVSSLPINVQAYMITGSQLGALLAFLVLASLVLLLHKPNRRYWALVTFLVLALAMAHSISSTFFIAFISITFLLIYLFPKILNSNELKHFLKGGTVLTAVLISVFWLMFEAQRALQALVGAAFSMVPSGVTPSNEYIPSRFFELLKANALEGVKASLVYYGAEAFLLFLSLVGLLVLFQIRNKSDRVARFLWVYGGVILLSIPIAALIKIGTFRILYFSYPILIVFSGFVLYASRKRVWLATLVLSTIIVLVPIELYACQPLIAPATAVNKALPVNVPIGYVNAVNSVYQRKMIIFAKDHIRGEIIADSATGFLLIALAGYDYTDAHLIEWRNPLISPQYVARYDFSLIHIPGKSGSIEEKAEVRVPSLILGSVYNSTVVYTNGESFVLGAFQPVKQ